jgi:hypothetical protein
LKVVEPRLGHGGSNRRNARRRRGYREHGSHRRGCATAARIDGIDFIFGGGASAATVLDNLHQRMVVKLYRLTRWINSSTPDITAIRHPNRSRERAGQRPPQPDRWT